MMNRALILGSMLVPLSSPAWAADESVKLQMNGQTVELVHLADRNITISSNCVKKRVLADCEAARALKTANQAKLPAESFGRNPGALICSQQLGGTVTWAHDEKQNERTFCKFRDNSFVGSGTLAFYAEKNAHAAARPKP